MPERWEVWLAKVKFEDDPTTVKQWPVLVISNTQCYILSLKMTSHPPRETFPGEYALLRWQEAGFQKESTVRASKRLRLIDSDFVHKIGRLHPIDILAIQKILDEISR